jgi:hypothetical protein
MKNDDDDELNDIINGAMMNALTIKPKPTQPKSVATNNTTAGKHTVKTNGSQIVTVKPPKDYSEYIDIGSGESCECCSNVIFNMRYFCQGVANGYPYWVNNNKIFLWADKKGTYYFGHSIGNDKFGVSIPDGFKHNGYHKFDGEISLVGGYDGFHHNAPNKKFHCKKCKNIFLVLASDKYKIQLRYDDRMRIVEKGINWCYLPGQVSRIPHEQRPKGWMGSTMEINISNKYHEHNLGDGRGYPINCSGYYNVQGYTDNGYPYLVNFKGDYLWANDKGVYYFGYSIGRDDHRIAKHGGFGGHYNPRSEGFHCEHCNVWFKGSVAERGVPH